MIEQILLNYFERCQRFRLRHFIGEMILLSFIFKFAGSIIGGYTLSILDLSSNDETHFAIKMGFLGFVVTSILISPILETLIGQWFPIFITSKFTKKLVYLTIFPCLIFAILHISVNAFRVWIVFFPGLIYTWTFLIQRTRSRWRAFWVTALIHGIHNLISLVMLALGI